MSESQFQKSFLDKLKKRFPEMICIKNDSSYIQGFPDWTIFYKSKYAVLEMKKSRTASHQPNQEYYVNKFAEDTFSRFVYPENAEEVYNEISEFFESGR